MSQTTHEGCNLEVTHRFVTVTYIQTDSTGGSTGLGPESDDYSCSFVYRQNFETELCDCVLAAEGVWKVSMTTSDVRDAWTEGAEVAVVLCGDKRDSSVHTLMTDNKASLRRGRTAEFTVLTL